MKIRYQFSLIFLVTTLIIVFISSAIIYYKTKNMILEEKYAHLESITQTKETRVKAIIKKKLETVNVLSRTVQANSIIDPTSLKISPKDQSYIAPIKRYKDALHSVKNLYLINKDGIIFEAFDDAQVGRMYVPKDTGNWYQDYWKAREVQSHFIDGFFHNPEKELVICICSPVFLSNIFIGTIVTEIDASDIISLTNDYTGLGKTGETVLVKKDDPVVFLTPTRFHKDSLKEFQTESIDHENVLFHAFQKTEGLLFDHYDYRGEKVLASTRYIEETDWAMVTKIDKMETMEPVNKLKRIVLTMNMVILVIVFLAALEAGNYFTRPLTKLIESVNTFKEGDFSKRIKIRSKNEMGLLAAAFNEMGSRLQKKIKELKHSNESLNKFAYIITHDLKSPIISIASLAKILKAEYHNKILDDEGNKILDMMVLKTQHAEELIEGVLASAKKGFSVKEREIINTHNLLNNIIDNLNPPHHINIIIHSPLPFLHYNKVALIQIFQNLLSNAIKFINKPIGIIEIGGEEMEDKIKFYIKDNGPGIKESDFSKIFLLFGENKTKEGVESHGIGLSIVKKIITENNGEIWLESELGKGTTFFFTIPKFESQFQD